MSDSQLCDSVRAHFDSLRRQGDARALWIESAGGVHSPTLSGTSQLVAVRALRPPVLLVSSAQLGGIATTLSALESLMLHGFDVDGLVLWREATYDNASYLARHHLLSDVPSATLDLPPVRLASKADDAAQMHDYFARQEDEAARLVRALQARHERRLAELDEMPAKARSKVWWPFVQHRHVESDGQVLAIDSAHRDHFAAASSSRSSDDEVLRPVLDGSASWWTQTVGHGDASLALAAANAASRYGHVMFPRAMHAPAMRLTERMLSNDVGRGWASRVFFSDNGSTATEVAIKMALRTYVRQKGELGRERRASLGVLGLKGAYHGDTIGAMDAADPNVYNEAVEWYTGRRGLWLDPPCIRLERGVYVVRDASGKKLASFDSLDELYDVHARLDSDLAAVYRRQIEDALDGHDGELGALMLEPLVMGASGMLFVDALFQRLLVDVARSTRSLPVVFDEVFVGLNRLGPPLSARQVLGVDPDVACYAKMLTGGVVPLALTLARQNVFDAFDDESKSNALLHGHSYTAHAIGCSVANASLDLLEPFEHSTTWRDAVRDWTPAASSTATAKASLWSREVVHRLSHATDKVKGVMALGTVLAIELVPGSISQASSAASGYESHEAERLLERLELGGAGDKLHARPLGNVAYFMASVNSSRETLATLERALTAALE